MLYTAAPSTWPTGSKPTLRIAANSSADSAEPQVPLRRISAIRASAVAGSPDPGRAPPPGSAGCCCANASPFPRRLCDHHPTGESLVVGSVPGFVALVHGLQRVFGRLPRRIWPELVLARTFAVVGLHRVVLEAKPPALLCVHAK